MPKFIPDSELHELQKDTRTNIYHVRKRLVGKPELLKSTGTRDRTKARRIAMQLLAEYWSTEKPISKKPTFKEIADKVYALKSTKSKATKELAHNRLYKHLCPYFGYMVIDKITENTWEEYIKDELSAKDRTLNDDAKLMKSVMFYAFNERLIDRRVKIRNPDPPNEEGRAYTEDEFLKLMSAASTPEMELQIEIGYTMGMRHGEIASLRWEWINFDRKTISIPKEITKTRRGRVVPINEEVIDHLVSFCEESGPVFPSKKDPSKSIPDFDSQWQRTWRRAGIKGRFHWLRHTCISNMASKGVPESTIKKIVGCSERTMRRVYLHLKDDVAASAVNL